MAMDFDTYMAGVKAKSGKDWREVLEILKQNGFTKTGTSAAMVKEYLQKEFGIGHGHAMGLWKVLKPHIE